MPSKFIKLKLLYYFLAVFVLMAGCASQRREIDDLELLRHTTPIKIFGVGYWRKGFTVLTLVDANKQYFTIIRQSNDSLKIGLVYRR